MTARQIISACWIIFVLYWLISAWSVKAVAERQGLMGWLANGIPVFLGAALLGWRQPAFPLSLVLIPHTTASAALGVAVCVLGLLGAIWSRRTLADNWSGTVTFKEGHELVDTGPYRFVRHPIYTSLLMMVLGSAIAAGRLAGLVGFLLFVVGFWIKIRQEEEVMARHFPDRYAEYKSRVKALVPFIL